MLTVMLAILANPLAWVHPEMGTVNDPHGKFCCSLSSGNLYPMTARPWGFGGWSPQTRGNKRSGWFYDYSDSRLYGIRYTRQPSPWIGDHGAWAFLPVVGAVDGDIEKRFSWISHKAETISPAEYGVFMSDFNVSVSLAPALHGAIAKITYPKTDSPGLVVDPFKDGDVSLAADGFSVVGTSRRNSNSYDATTPLQLHFIVKLPRKATAEKLADGALHVRFDPMARSETIELRIATSFMSGKQAEVNLGETERLDFAALREDARREWNERLGKIEIDSSDQDALKTFYTCFYRTMLFPLAVWERTADGKVVHWSPATGETKTGYYYAGTGFWDTFRALFPLVNLLAPEMSARMMEGLQHCWKESGWLPEWSSPGIVNCMIGNNSASVVADAWLSGIRGNFDIEELWKAIEHGANNVHAKIPSNGRLGFEFYNRLGYVPRDVEIKESAARTLEYAYDDWCIAELAKSLGKKEAEELYRKRSGNWRNVFDPERKIAVGRNKDGSFNKDFNRFAWGGDFTEGCALHYTWSVFHDVPGLMAAMGGERAFEKRLDEIFAIPPLADCTQYGSVIHEAREMQVMNMGQYAHGNQPIQHMIYLYDWCGAWGKAQQWTREVMDRLYRATPDGYCGDEDNGQTSAWYVWSALGMYPVCPGAGEYALGAPRFDVMTVMLPGGKKLHIRAKGAERRNKFASAMLEGRSVVPFVKADAVRRGGTLAFQIENLNAPNL